jgi:CRISPR-associated endonuclease/helicase Cas3
MDNRFCAHSLPGRPSSAWEPLFTPFGDDPATHCQRDSCSKCRDLAPDHGHLNKVAYWTATFAAAMFPPGKDRDAAWQWGYLAGLWHDLGKFAPDFQRKLHGDRVHLEHAGAGALLAKELAGSFWETLGFVIAGHHAGLANRMSKEGTGDKNTALTDRIARAAPAIEICRKAITESSPATAEDLLSLVKQPPLLEHIKADGSGHWSHFIRMIFAALVDADSICTERFCSPSDPKTKLRATPSYDDIPSLCAKLDAKLDDLMRSAADTEVNRQRRNIVNWCRSAAKEAPGFLSLNVPTGGGKTLAAMSFALRHVAAHQASGMRRVIVAVPYTSIIEQNSGVYSGALGSANVVEHHSNLDDFEEAGEADETTVRRRLSCENWDAPVIVTTNVQLFESLFAHKRRRARKLHNIAGSVIILDEAQCVPVGFMDLIVPTLRDLVDHYGCTVVISTATQPAWQQRRGKPSFGLPEDTLRPIIPWDAKLSWIDAFDRVEIEWPQSTQPVPHEELARKLADEPCVMAIVHRKKDAQWLARKLKEIRPTERTVHLSTNMCPAHRRRTLEEIRAALVEHRESGTPCRVVSTQLVEAGVDLDLPVIYRAMAGLDSIVQAAGRCNREGKLSGKGRVVVFHSESLPPDCHLKRCAEITAEMLRELDNQIDVRDPAMFEMFFRKLYFASNTDTKLLVRHERDLNFETLGREFRLIDETQQVPVVILYDEEAKSRLKTVRSIALRPDNEDVAARVALRALQPYTVAVWPKGLTVLAKALEPLFPGSTTLTLDPFLFPAAYDETFGLVTDDEPTIPPDRLVCS